MLKLNFFSLFKLIICLFKNIFHNSIHIRIYVHNIMEESNTMYMRF